LLTELNEKLALMTKHHSSLLSSVLCQRERNASRLLSLSEYVDEALLSSERAAKQEEEENERLFTLQEKEVEIHVTTLLEQQKRERVDSQRCLSTYQRVFTMPKNPRFPKIILTLPPDLT